MALSTAYTGKYTSERHESAKQSGKLTAGEVAKLINKRFKPEPKVTASELRPFATEWHHSGFYKSHCRSTMGKTWFFDAEIFENFESEYYTKILSAREEEAAIAAEVSELVFYFKAGFEKRGSGRRSFWQPIAELGEAEVKASEYPSFFSKREKICKEDYCQFNKYNGRSLERYESFESFKERMLFLEEREAIQIEKCKIKVVNSAAENEEKNKAIDLEFESIKVDELFIQEKNDALKLSGADKNDAMIRTLKNLLRRNGIEKLNYFYQIMKRLQK